MYAVTASMTYIHKQGYKCRCDYPTFFLDESVLGITDKGQAERIAKAMLMEPLKAIPCSLWADNMEFHVNAEKV